MGNTNSRDKKKYLPSKVRRQSNRSTMSTRFSSPSLSSFTTSSRHALDSDNKVQPQHNNLLDKIKHGHKKNTSQLSLSHFEPTSPCSTCHYSVNEVPLIEKYTDSQMSLLYNHNNNSGIHSTSQVDNNNTTTNASIFTNNSISTLNTTTTNNTNYTNNNNISESTEEMKKAYSSELMLKELYMLGETSPERRRDRDR